MRITEENLKNFKKVFVVDEYRDSWGIGSQEFFDSEEEAIRYAGKEWDRLCDSDKKTYLNDKSAWFIVTENEVIEENDEFVVNTESLRTIWEAF